MRKIPELEFITVGRLLPLALLLALSGCTGGGGSAPPPPNLPPVANNSCAYVSGINQPLNGNLSATDPEGQSLTYSIVSSASKGSAIITNPLTGAFSYTPNNNTRGEDTFMFRACEAAPSTLCSDTVTYKIVHTPRIMPLGDSITEGVNDGEMATSPSCTNSNPCPALANRVSYRKDLRDALVAAGYTIEFVGTQASGTSLMSNDRHEGHGGWSADELVNGNSNPTAGTGSNAASGGYLSNWLNGKKDTAASPDPANAGWPDVILLHIGTNDLSSGYQSSLWNRVNAIRATIKTWESTHWPVTVIYTRIINENPVATDETYFNDDVISNVVLPAISGGDQAGWIHQEAALFNQASYYGDSIHPSASGYQTMANFWLYPLAGIGTPSGTFLSGPGILPKCP